jgi:hypothetical protein
MVRMTVLVASVGRIMGMVVVVPVGMRMSVIRIVTMGMSVMRMIIALTIHHTEARRANAGSQNRASIDPHICFVFFIRVQNEAPQCRSDLLDRQACIYERAQDHVP